MRSSTLLLLAVLAGCLALFVSGSGDVNCPAGVPQVACLMDPCAHIRSCKFGCGADYCGACTARCACRNNFDCDRLNGELCDKGKGQSMGLCSKPAPEMPEPVQTCRMLCKNGTICREGRCMKREEVADVLPVPAVEKVTDAAPTPAAEETPSASDKPAAAPVAAPASDDKAPPPKMVPAAPDQAEAATQQKEPARVLDMCTLMRCGYDTVCRDGACVSQPCKSHKDCDDDGKYCGSESKCVSKGGCNVAADCTRDPSWFHAMCVGEAKCSAQRKCQWQCTKF